MNPKSILPLLLVLILAACSPGTPVATTLPPTSYPPPADTPVPLPATPYPQPESTQTPESVTYPEPATPPPLTALQTVQALSTEVINALKDQNMLALSGATHPTQGLRFTPYAYVQDTDLVFDAGQVAGLMSDTTKYTWGVFDGSGEPIEMTFPEYYARFIYDVDFANAPQVAVNQRLGMGNSIDNSSEFYPGAMIVEYYFPGIDPQYQGMDWRSLRLVFQEYEGIWYLVGIIHDEWTT
jgi:hypothetical protein